MNNTVTFDFNLVIMRDERGEYTTKIVPLAPLPPIAPRLDEFLDKAEEVADKHLENKD